jgi:hypothetical protein
MAKKATDYKALFLECRGLLRDVQFRCFHEPDPDNREYCAGCGRSPYNVPPHTPECIVPKITAFMNKRIENP